MSIAVTRNKHKFPPTIWKLVTSTREGSRHCRGPAPQHATQILLCGQGLQEQKARRSLLMPKPGYPGGRAVFISCQCLKSGALAPGWGSRAGSSWVQVRTYFSGEQAPDQEARLPSGARLTAGRARWGGCWVTEGRGDRELPAQPLTGPAVSHSQKAVAAGKGSRAVRKLGGHLRGRPGVPLEPQGRCWWWWVGQGQTRDTRHTWTTVTDKTSP